MNLLLLLSALLSALTGVGGSVRAPDVAQAVAGQAAVVRAAAPLRRAVASRPVADLPTLSVSARAAPQSIMPLAGIEPLWATRRRE